MTGCAENLRNGSSCQPTNVCFTKRTRRLSHSSVSAWKLKHAGWVQLWYQLPRLAVALLAVAGVLLGVPTEPLPSCLHTYLPRKLRPRVSFVVQCVRQLGESSWRYIQLPMRLLNDVQHIPHWCKNNCINLLLPRVCANAAARRRTLRHRRRLSWTQSICDKSRSNYACPRGLYPQCFLQTTTQPSFHTLAPLFDVGVPMLDFS